MTPSPIEAARARHSLAEVAARTGVGPFRTTGSVTVRCPLPSHGHFDATPSLRLHLDDGIFSCFGCGAKGDVVEWVRQTEGVDWRKGIQILDQRRPLTNTWAGGARGSGERPPYPPADHGQARALVGQSEPPDLERTPPERVHEVLDVAWGYYSCPPLHCRGELYLRQRQIDVGVLEAHTGRLEVGHSPAKADGLVTFLRSRGFRDDELVDAGLARRRLGGGPISDFFRERVLIPIRDDQHRVAGFIGRNVGDQQRWSKYTNPPRTHAYDKSVNLYKPLLAPSDPEGQIVVVEGTLDAMAIAVAAIRSSQASRFCPVTQSGRELSPVQLTQVIEMHPGTVVLGFDGDRAGQDSAYRHALAAARKGWRVTVTLLPDDHDPASWLAKYGDRSINAWALGGERQFPHTAPHPMPGTTFLATCRASLGSPSSGTPAVDVTGVAL